MVRTPPKRTASHSPDNGRPYKRFATSSPEEGEVNDDEDVVHGLPRTPPRPVSPPRPSPKFETKVKFPFKRKNGVEAGTQAPKADAKEKETPAVIYERSEEDERRFREKEQQRKPWSSHLDLSRRISHSSKSNLADHWEPSLDYANRDKERSRLPGSGWQYDQQASSRHRRSTATTDRDSYLPRSRGRSSPSPSRSTSSSTSARRGKHRLPSHHDRSPVGNYSPPRRDYGVDRIRDKQRERDDAWDRDRDLDRRYNDDGYGRRDDRYYSTRDDRGYNGDHDDRYWRPGMSPARQDYGQRDDYDYGARTGRRGMDSYRPASPGLSARTVSTSVYPPRSPSPPHTAADGPRTPPLPSEPPPLPPLPTDSKDETLPISHVAVSISLPIRRPGAPLDLHSPTPLPLPPADESVVKREHERKDSEGEVREVKKRAPVRRSRKEEYEAYGRSFEGCGMQSDYDVTTKLGEGTFG
jgi:serine/threonine-protein kinase BUR1